MTGPSLPTHATEWLRIKLQNDYRHPCFIATVPAHGYRFIPTFTNAGWDGGPAPAATRPD